MEFPSRPAARNVTSDFELDCRNSELGVATNLVQLSRIVEAIRGGEFDRYRGHDPLTEFVRLAYRQSSLSPVETDSTVGSSLLSLDGLLRRVGVGSRDIRGGSIVDVGVTVEGSLVAVPVEDLTIAW